MVSEKILTAEEILAAADVGEKVVPVPEWGGAVRIRGLTKAMQQHLRRAATVGNTVDADRLELLMFVHCVVEPKFTEEQVEALRQKSAAAIDRVLREVFALQGITPEAQDQMLRTFRPGNA
jgi:hypothetical protein